MGRGVHIEKIQGGVENVFFSIADSYSIIRAVRPDIVIGVGGYASVGPVFTAFLCICANDDSRAEFCAGLANKVLGKFAGAVRGYISESIPFFPNTKTFLTGNPIRMRILKGSKDAAHNIFSLEKDKFTVFIFWRQFRRKEYKPCNGGCL